MIRYYNFEQRSEKWRIYRKDKWTGSTAIDLLSGKKAPPEGDPSYDNKYMQRGRILEPLAAEAYEHKYGIKMQHFGFVTNSEYPHAGYSPDGIEPGFVDEIKCLGVQKHDNIVNGEIPIPTDYIAQMQFGMLITGLPAAKFILYNPDSDTPLFVIEIKADPSIQAFMKDRLEITRPKGRPSANRAKQRYVENNSAKIKAARHKRYVRGKTNGPKNTATRTKRKSA